MVLVCTFVFFAGCMKDTKKASGKNSSAIDTISETGSATEGTEGGAVTTPFIPKEKSASQASAENAQAESSQAVQSTQSKSSKSNSVFSDTYEGGGY